MKPKFKKATVTDIEQIKDIMDTITEAMEDASYFVSGDMEYIRSHIAETGVTYLLLDRSNRLRREKPNMSSHETTCASVFLRIIFSLILVKASRMFNAYHLESIEQF